MSDFLAALLDRQAADGFQGKRAYVPHDHIEFQDWCFRCHLSRDEEEDVD